ncbi:GNAT family N-acetyltransferase [Aliivibrio kagoshimensis]|uniref:GNAT family N-acetyltransferase n=1 Tax=Aliivibrio kagoshimensis TaxID=2910230 RepID=UPI003D13D56D
MYEFKIVAFSDEMSQIKKVRHTVFTQEQGVDGAIDFDGQDKLAIHILALKAEQVVGTGRMLEDGHIGRIAILKSARGEGLGAKVVQGLVDEAQKLDFTKVYLGSQLHAVDFYRKLGFSPYGEEYIEADIRHVSMQKRLP